jgi:hypothetical protein
MQTAIFWFWSLAVIILIIYDSTVSAVTSTTTEATTTGPLRKLIIGMLFPQGESEYQSFYGYSSSASAMSIALDRIESEGLLPNINITFVLDLLNNYHYLLIIV